MPDNATLGFHYIWKWVKNPLPDQFLDIIDTGLGIQSAKIAT